MADTPSWIAELNDEWLRDHFDPGTLERARQVLAERRIQSTQVTGDVVMATVKGSGFQTYTTMLTRRGARVTTSCTCPMRGECKHCAAVVLHLRWQRQPSQAADWQRVLSKIAMAERPDDGIPLALQFSNDAPAQVGMRVMAMGRSEKWVKSITDWAKLKYPFNRDFNERQRQALVELQAARSAERVGYYSYGESPVLMLGELSREAWLRLRAARAAGIVFLPPQGLREVVVSDSPAVLSISLSLDADGDLQLRPSASLDGEEIQLSQGNLLGMPPHGLVRRSADALILTPLDRPLEADERELFTGSKRLRVPASDVPLFAGGFLPALRRRLRVDDEGIELPEAQPPRLLARIDLSDDEAFITWGFRYVIGERTVDVHLAGHHDDPPVRNAEQERALLDGMSDPGPWSALAYDGLPTLQSASLTGRELIDFVTHTLPAWRERQDLAVEVSGTPRQYREASSAPVVRLGVQPPDATHWFNLDVDVSIDGEQVPFIDMFRALSLGQQELVLDSGLWFSLDRPELQQLRALIEEAALLGDRQPGEVRLRPEHAGLWEELVALGVVAEQSAAWRACVDTLLHTENLPETPVPGGVTATLRPYQLTGFRWLDFLWQAGLGGILADEMGLGKTLQALTWAARLADAGELHAPLLVVVPTSVIGTWVHEAATFTPGLTVRALTETSTKRGTPLADEIAGADVVVTSYTLLRLGEEEFAAQPWSGVLLDEAQFVKNRASQVYKAVRRLPGRLKVAMTGTPLENNLMDLWSLLSITAPGLFSDPRVFTDLYRRPIESGDADALARLHRRIRPLMLRRTKELVEAELPPKQEQLLMVDLLPAHRRLYDRHLQRERQKVLGLVGNLEQNRITILRSLTLLRQLSLAPRLIDETYPAHSAKIDTLVERLQELTEEGHRALVFSQFTSFLGLVRERLKDEGIAASYLDGRTRDRQRRIAEFREGTDPVFLISLKAGGFGLTLIEADYVFILDPWWNPAAENQAIDRTHRIGQTAHVMVYRLVSSGTIEEKVVELQQRKRDLFDRVVGDGTEMAAPLTAADIRGLLEG